MNRELLFVASILVAALSFGCDRVQEGLRGLGATTDSTNETVEDEDSPVPRVDYCVVQNERVPLTREIPGRTVASQVAQVRPRVEGIVQKRLFEEGSFVEEGDVLYEIESNVYRANYEKAEANLDELARRRDRAALLKDKLATSQEEYESSLYAFKQAKAEFDLAALDLNYCQIKAPISGIIGFSTITVGALVASGQEQELATIQCVDPIYVDVNVSAAALAEAKLQGANDYLKGAKVELLLEDGSKYPESGTIRRADNAFQEDVGTIALRAEFPNPNGIVLPGAFVRAIVEEGVREDGKTIPQRALFRDPKGAPYVWVVREDSIVERRSIVSERVVDGKALVDSGLEKGERVVVEGSQYVSEGVAVNAVELSEENDSNSEI